MCDSGVRLLARTMSLGFVRAGVGNCVLHSFFVRSGLSLTNASQMLSCLTPSQLVIDIFFAELGVGPRTSSLLGKRPPPSCTLPFVPLYGLMILHWVAVTQFGYLFIGSWAFLFPLWLVGIMRL